MAAQIGLVARIALAMMLQRSILVPTSASSSAVRSDNHGFIELKDDLRRLQISGAPIATEAPSQTPFVGIGAAVPIALVSLNSPITVAKGRMFFQGCDAVHGCELWMSDGASQTAIVSDYRPGTQSSLPTGMIEF